MDEGYYHEDEEMEMEKTSTSDGKRYTQCTYPRGVKQQLKVLPGV
jgi:hypothetical protein